MTGRDLIIWGLAAFLFLSWGSLRLIHRFRRSRFLSGAGRKQVAALKLLEEQGYRYGGPGRTIRLEIRQEGKNRSRTLKTDLTAARGLRYYPVVARYRRGKDSSRDPAQWLSLARAYPGRTLLNVDLSARTVRQVDVTPRKSGEKGR